MRVQYLILALIASGCASAPPQAPVDPIHHANLTIQGFTESNPLVAARLQTAAAWAVFSDVEDSLEPSIHEGTLFQRGKPPRRAHLSSTTEPPAPAGAAYHLLVVIEHPGELQKLTAEGLDLNAIHHAAATATNAPPNHPSSTWTITSQRSSLLFPHPPTHQQLTLPPGN